MKLINNKKILLKFFSSVLVVMLLFSVWSAVPSVSAAAYSGKGTKSDPYLVQTAEQLQGMKDNLSAHYKLANTIDMSSFGEFTPIGNLAKPFTGSFTCDTDSDGTPKYAIKNLKVYINAGEKYGHKAGTNVGYVDYKENNSNWEAALFGSAKGATFKNIALLDVNITNTVVGQNRMNGDWSLNPGQDEQGAAALVAIAEAITAENCSATGNVNSKSNHCGGLFGRLISSTVKNSYSTVKVTSDGGWCHGGFFGAGNENTVTNCFASGDVDADKYRVAGFVGGGGGTFSNCYSTGAVTKGKSFHTSENEISLSNCVTLSISATVNTEGIESKVSNCLVVEGGSQGDFTTASAAQIKTVIDSINSKIAIITDTSKYVPGAVDLSSATENSGAQQQSGNAQSGSEDASTEETVVKKTAEEITALVTELNEKAVMKTLTLEEALEGIKIKEYYAGMDEEEMKKVSKTTVSSFETIYSESSKVILNKITEKVEALPATEEITSENAKEIIELYEIYESLPESVKNYFEKDITDKLTECYNTAKDMANVKIVTKQIDSELTRMQTVLLIVLVTLNILALCGLGVLIFFCIKTVKKINVSQLDGYLAEELQEDE